MDNPNASRTGYWVAGIIAAILIIGGIVLWRSNVSVSQGTPTDTGVASTTSGRMIHSYGPVTLGFGQSASFSGITITPITLAQDSRCAAGTQCVQAGTVQVAVRSDLDSGTSEQDTLTLGTATQVGDFSVTLTAVSPDKQPNSTISNSDYLFTFDVHQSASGVGLEGKG